MLGITVRSAIEELSAVPGGGEVIVVDNSDPHIQKVVADVFPGRYVKRNKIRIFYQDFPCLFTAREEAARQAKGDYIFCVDSHCIFGHDSIINAVHFMNRHKREPIGFGHVPVNWLCQHEETARHDMKMIHGSWGKLYDYERPISWKGMPWICRRSWFLEQLNGYGLFAKHKLAWGGGDMYLGLKAWMLGYENWAIPSRPVIHIGPLPVSLRQFHAYRVYSKSGDTTQYVGWVAALLSMGADSYIESKDFQKFMDIRFGGAKDKILREAKKYVERVWFKKHSKRSFDELLQEPWNDL